MDANEAASLVVDALPADSLSVAFLDPYGLHLNFETLRTLSQRRVDLILFFSDHLDALRNWKFYAAQPNSNLDRVLGGAPWLSRVQSSAQSQWARMLRDVYEEQLRTVGYDHFEYQRIRRPDGSPLYLLIYCCRHPVGAEIWRNTSQTLADGQRSFDFGA